MGRMSPVDWVLHSCEKSSDLICSNVYNIWAKLLQRIRKRTLELCLLTLGCKDQSRICHIWETVSRWREMVISDILYSYCSSLLPLLLEKKKMWSFVIHVTSLISTGEPGEMTVKTSCFLVWFELKFEFKHAGMSPLSLKSSREQLQRQPDAHRW